MATDPSQPSGVEEVTQKEGDQEQIVTPWVAHAAQGDKVIDYEKLISKCVHIGRVQSVHCASVY